MPVARAVLSMCDTTRADPVQEPSWQGLFQLGREAANRRRLVLPLQNYLYEGKTGERTGLSRDSRVPAMHACFNSSSYRPTPSPMLYTYRSGETKETEKKRKAAVTGREGKEESNTHSHRTRGISDVSGLPSPAAPRRRTKKEKKRGGGACLKATRASAPLPRHLVPRPGRFEQS